MDESPSCVKVFDVVGGRVLFMLDQDDEGSPSVIQRTVIDGIAIGIGMVFTDTEEGHDHRQRIFESLGQEDAEKYMIGARKLLCPE